MNEDFNIWLEGAPVIPSPGGNTFSIWLEGAPVITVSDDANLTVVSTGSGAEAGGGTGDVIADFAVVSTGSGAEAGGDSGTVVITGDITVISTGSGAQAGGGAGTVIVPAPPTPVFPIGFAGYTETGHRYVNPRRRARKKVSIDTYESLENPPLEPEITRVRVPNIVVVRDYGSGARALVGNSRVLIEYPVEEAEIEALILAMVPQMDVFDLKTAEKRKKPNKKAQNAMVPPEEQDAFDLDSDDQELLEIVASIDL